MPPNAYAWDAWANQMAAVITSKDHLFKTDLILGKCKLHFARHTL